MKGMIAPLFTVIEESQQYRYHQNTQTVQSSVKILHETYQYPCRAHDRERPPLHLLIILIFHDKERQEDVDLNSVGFVFYLGMHMKL